MRAVKQVVFKHVLDTCYRTLNNKYTGYVDVTYLNIYNHLIKEYIKLLDDEMQ